MKNSSDPIATKSLTQLLASLQGIEDTTKISERIDQAYFSFRPKLMEIGSYCEFINEIAGFVRHLYRYGLTIPRVVSTSFSMSEGLDLIDRYYESCGIRGLDAAYLDTADEKGRGFEAVLHEVAEIIKDIEIRRYLNSRFLTLIDPTDRDTHRRIVVHLVGEYGTLLPREFHTGNPARFAKYYRELLELIISSDSILHPARTPKYLTGN
jgi:hypothetical protein